MENFNGFSIFFCLRFLIAFFKKPPAERHKTILKYVFKNNFIHCCFNGCTICKRFFNT